MNGHAHNRPWIALIVIGLLVFGALFGIRSMLNRQDTTDEGRKAPALTEQVMPAARNAPAAEPTALSASATPGPATGPASYGCPCMNPDYSN